MFRIHERVFAVLVVALAATTVDAQTHRYQTTFAREIPYRAGAVTIEHRFGSVAIRVGSSSQVSVRASIRSSDPAFGERIRVTTAHDANGVTIRTEYPDRATERKGNFSYSVELDVTVPRNAPLRVRNRFGSVQASGIAGGSTLVNGHGSISLTAARGEQSVQNSFGSISARDIGGNLHARNSHGSIQVDGIRGTAVLENRFGSIHLENVDRDVTVTNSHGSVDASNIRSNTRVVNSFGSTDVDDIDGALRVEGNHSRVNVRGVRGNADVSTTFGAVDVEDIRGTLRVTNNNGSVQAADVESDATVRTSFGSATLQNVRGGLDVENRNGAITVSGVAKGACRPISLRTSDSSIKVGVPSGGSYAVNARTTHGRIISALPITSTRTSAGGERVVGTIGGGGCQLELINSNGSITIARE